MWVLLTIAVAGAILIAYVMIEKRVNQRSCPACGFNVSIDALSETCPRCGTTIEPQQQR